MYRSSIVHFTYELPLWKKNFIVIGVDEVGRGAFAGPLVAAAYAAFPHIRALKQQMRIENIIVNDSKKISKNQRERTVEWLIRNRNSFTLGTSSISEINRLGVAKANILAMRRAVSKLVGQLQTDTNCFVLSDYFHIPNLRRIGRKNQLAIMKGDEQCFSIAAASIIAKVYRDNLMQELSVRYPAYGWAKNRGYGTQLHREALKRYGQTRHHRLSFIS